jgi:protocatechuate 3,4-dioxygenase beta subunit
MRVHAFPLLLMTVGLAFGQQAPAAQADDEKKFASVEGKLIDDKTGEPIRRANVSLMQMTLQPTMTMGPPPNTVVATDAEGKFTFSRVEPGRYMLSAEKAGYVRQQYGSRAAQMGPGTTLTIEAGQKITNIDFRLLPQAVITGKVVDDEGEPVPHVMVSMLRQMPMSRQPLSTMAMSTNDVGEFRLANVAPGRYTIRAELRGGMPGMPTTTPAADPNVEGTLGYVSTYYPGVTDPASATPINVTAGQQLAGVDIRLRKDRVFQVMGKVQGAPAGNRLQVTLQPQVARGAMQSYNFGGGGSSKPDGSFTISNVLPGSYDAIVMTFEMGGRPQMVGRTPVTVTNRNVADLVIQAGVPLDLVGRVIVEGDGVAKPSGQVMIQPVQPLPMFAPPSRIQDDGTFKINGVAREKFYLHVTGLEADAYVKSVRAGDIDVTSQGLDLTGSTTAPPIEIRVSTKGATVDGAVMDGDKPAPGVVVAMLPHPFEPAQSAMMRKTATTDQNGRFSVKGVAPGEYRVYAWDTFVPVTFLDAEQLKEFDKLAVAVKVKEKSREQVALKLASVNKE